MSYLNLLIGINIFNVVNVLNIKVKFFFVSQNLEEEKLESFNIFDHIHPKNYMNTLVFFLLSLIYTYSN